MAAPLPILRLGPRWVRSSSRPGGVQAVGELAALRVKRLDLLRGTVRVVESASEVGGRLVLRATKTYAERTVRLPRFLRDDLAVYLTGSADRPGRPPEGDPGTPGS